MEGARIGRPLVVRIQIPPALAAAAETYLTFSSDPPLRRWTTCLDGERQGLGQEPIGVGCLDIQVDLGATSASPDSIQQQRGRRGQQSPKSVECPVVDATVDVERGDTKEP